MKKITLLFSLLVFMLGIHAQGVFISQNCDPQYDYAGNRFVEIYNSANESVDLTGWTVDFVQNGDSTSSWILSGSIASGEALICGFNSHTKIVPDFLSSSSNSSWNGGNNDGAILRHGSDTIDYAIGKSYANGQMVRISSVTNSSKTYDSNEWVVSSVANADDSNATPGIHACDLPLNFAPIITNFLPADGSEIQKDSSFTISAVVKISHVDGIDSVMLYTGSESGVYDDSVKMMFTADTFSYSNTLTDKGIFYGKIVAYGVNGERTMSAEQSITIYVPGPVISNVTPESGLVFDLGVDVVISAEASTSVGVIDSVVLYFGPAPDFLVRRERCDFSEGVYSSIRYFDAESTFYGQLVAYGSNGENDSTDIVTAFGQCGERIAPIALVASDITAAGFTAHWDRTLDAESYELDVWTEGDEIDMAADGLGTQDDPFSVSQALALSHGTDRFYYKGYVVGQGSNIPFEAPAANDYSILVAESVDETDVAKVLVVKVESDDRADWGLASNSALYQTKVIAEGFRDAYSGGESIEGVSNFSSDIPKVKNYVLQGENLTDTFKVISELVSGTSYNYSVKAVTEYGCKSASSNSIVAETAVVTAIKELESGVLVFASQGSIHLRLEGEQSVLVYDITGSQVAQKMVNGEASISIKSGIYLVKVAGQVIKVAVH